MTDLVSIIVPCYNQARFVKQAVASCLAQEYSAVQVIVIDDGSTDDPRTALGELIEHPQLVFLRQENRGVANARNAGIAAAAGTYLKFLDADDWLAPTLLRKQVEMLCANPEIGFTFCDRIRVNERGETLDAGTAAQRSASLNGDLFPLLLLGGFFPPLTVMTPRRVLDKVGMFDQRCAPCEDYDLWLRITGHGYPALFLNEALAYYRQHDGNASRDRALIESQQRAVLQKIVAQFPERTANALYELGTQFAALNGAHDSARARENAQQGWIQQLERDKTSLQQSADAREAYLREIENNSVFHALVNMGILKRRRER